MSVVSTSANYGGKISDYQQNIKQFVVSEGSQVTWVYKRHSDGLVALTPANSKMPVLIQNDLIVTGSIYNTSDLRLKRDISDITYSAYDELCELRPISFAYKSDTTNRRHYGVLAQDVERAFPELVESNLDGFKTVNYLELVPLMLAKIQNMQEQIDSLTALAHSHE